MKKLDSLLLRVFLYTLPVFALLAGCGYFTGMEAMNRYVPEIVNNFLGILVASWMALAVYLSVRLLVSGPFREQVITKITPIRERDEREAHLTGKAARATFLTTLALLILLFCLNTLSVSFYRVPPEMAVNGKTGHVSLGVGFDLLKNNQSERMDAIPKQYLFNYKGLPLSSSLIILILFAWQIVVFNLSMRRLMK